MNWSQLHLTLLVDRGHALIHFRGPRATQPQDARCMGAVIAPTGGAANARWRTALPRSALISPVQQRNLVVRTSTQQAAQQKPNTTDSCGVETTGV
jgi:hypothetical protein